MANKHSKRSRRTPRSSVRPRFTAGGPRLVTAEGAPIVFASARYRHTDPDGIRQVLSATDDFDLHEPDDPTSGTQTGSWLQTGSGSELFQPGLGYRVLANLTLTSTTLEVEAMSKQRLADCRKRLEGLLGDRLRFESLTTRSLAQAMREAPSRPEPEPVQPPPEVVAQIEEAMLKQWISEPIPTLGGLTPLQAVKTPEGKQRVLELIDEAGRMQQRAKAVGGFAPDYRKTKKMLGLE